MIPPGPFSMPQSNRSVEDDGSCISADSSIHESDYDSEDSSTLDEGGFGTPRRMAVMDDTSTISKSSLASMSLSSVGNTNVPQLAPTMELLQAADTSSSSSSGDGWKTESSSASNLSSVGDNSSTFDEARRHLQSRQNLRRTMSNSTRGSRFERPIDVETLKKRLALSQPDDKLAAARITRHRLGFENEDNDSLSQAIPPVSSSGHRIIGFATTAGRKHMLQGMNARQIASVPQEVPVPRQEEAGSAVGGNIPPYRELVRMISQRRGSTDIEKGSEQQEDARRRVAHRSDFEMCLIIVIAASLVSLVVLLGLLLRTRA